MLTDLIEKICAFLDRFKPLVILPPDEGGVRIRLGRLQATLAEGAHWCIPLADRVRTCKVSEQSIDLVNQTITVIGRTISTSGCIRFRVVDPALALLRADDYVETLNREALCTIADMIDDSATREEVEEAVEEGLVKQAKRWGLEILRVSLTDFAVGRVIRLIQ